ncbi:hypothetical protein BST36_20200 [Mycolicibacterium moriokaense]|jgi:hypothetical protein|uniref:Glycerophosphoryl diester phosphodiesterase membrane domain-containing protein n=1 Tax=Mycolicibacterium moriokaense TaxID=39691 RepID=A0AAD1M5D2_9MYCO|nr:DUF6159 family protein [Mycolicibacterium moriokaense]MCV7040166.1 hypothetical protein [Mycolicibacterium moriokaense]ORB20111.1 hypothetical protein BST36_20200 [Mycolicibacterium moriokaense]BBX00180.1 hypothetical protein MMOR_11160 [Mycolicibacterium moriokaense]
MGAISRGWALTKQSWVVLKNDRSLVIFPILSAAFATVAVVVIMVPTALVAGADQNNPGYAVAAVVTIYVSTFIAVFFNVALAACAARSLRGEDTTIGEGISAATRQLGPILGWTLVAGTVGLVLRILEERFPLAGRIAVWIAGAAWAVATFFVIPVIALEGTGPIRSLKRSVAVVRAKWGEGATGQVAISAVTGLIVFGLVLVGGAAGYALVAVGLAPVAFAVGAVAVAAVIVVAVVSSALNSIFRVAVYEYAATGQAPAAFDPALVQSAFGPRGRRA